MNLKRIYELPIDIIDPFPEHPFKVKNDEDMMNLVESIKEQGILTPATVRKKEDGRYEMEDMKWYLAIEDLEQVSLQALVH